MNQKLVGDLFQIFYEAGQIAALLNMLTHSPDNKIDGKALSSLADRVLLLLGEIENCERALKNSEREFFSIVEPHLTVVKTEMEKVLNFAQSK